MKKSVPFKKELIFNTNLAEVTSIALDHNLSLEDYVVKGNLIVSGSYKMNDNSINVEEFRFEIPVNIEMNKRYILDNLSINIDDFYYEIIDNNTLNVNIEIGLENLEEKEEEVKVISEMREDPVGINSIEVVDEDESSIRLDASDVKSLFSSFDESTETYSTYKVCIIKDGDTVESIILKYGTNRELLELYNDLSDIKIGDKMIIPSVKSEKSQ